MSRYSNHMERNANLARTIEAYWRERGREVSVSFGNGGHHSALKSKGIPANAQPNQQLRRG